MDENQLRAQNVSYDAFLKKARPDGQNFTVKFDGLYQFAIKEPRTRRKLILLFAGVLFAINFVFFGGRNTLGAGYALGGEAGVLVAIVCEMGLVGLGIYWSVLMVRLVKKQGRAELLGQGSALLEDRYKAYEANLKRNTLSSDIWP